MTIPLEKIDPEAEKVVRRLVRSGHAAYLVGGCVRDLLVGRRPKDFDVATSATPNETKELFRNCRIIGRRFRLAHIFFGSKIIETSTFRANPRDVDGGTGAEDEELLIRRDNVFGTAEEDARRRDFTINGLFYDLEVGEVIDYVGGLADLEARLVRTIGDPDIRFREDPVRILRAIKFAARLQFDFDPETYEGILTHRTEIAKCAAPRVLEEIYRLLRGAAARRSMELLIETGVADVLFPELGSLLGRSPADVTLTAAIHPPKARVRGWRLLEELDEKLQEGYPEERDPARLTTDTLRTRAATVDSPLDATPRTIADADTAPMRTAAPARVVSPFARPVPPPPPGQDPERDAWAAVWSSGTASPPRSVAPPPATSLASHAPPVQAPPPSARPTEPVASPGGPVPERGPRPPLPPRYQPTNALLLSLLAVPFLAELIEDADEHGGADPLAEIDLVLGPLSERLRASRRDQERARQILLAQRRLAPSKRRRNRPMMLVRRDWFDEALTLFELVTRADGQPEDEVVRWRAMGRRGPGSPDMLDGDEGPLGELEPQGQVAGVSVGENGAADPNGPRKRRRRRGGRRRKRAPGDSPALDPASGGEPEGGAAA